MNKVKVINKIKIIAGISFTVCIDGYSINI